MSAPLEGFQADSCKFRKSLASFIRHVGVIFGMEHRNFRRTIERKSPPSMRKPVGVKLSLGTSVISVTYVSDQITQSVHYSRFSIEKFLRELAFQ